MTTFTTEEQNLICLYNPGTREGLMQELLEMKRALMSDEQELESLTQGVLKKLERMTDDEYEEAVKVLDSFDPLSAEAFSDEDAAHGWYGPLTWFTAGPDAEIE